MCYALSAVPGSGMLCKPYYVNVSNHLQFVMWLTVDMPRGGLKCFHLVICHSPEYGSQI
jgi:hypothetical protein